MVAPDSLIEEAEPPSQRRPSPGAVLRKSSTRGPDLALRPSVVAADANATTEIHLSLLWRELARGVSQVVDGFFSDERCYLVLAMKSEPEPLEGRRLQILEAVLSGLRQKSIAIDMQLAPSTVALNSRLALESLGVSGKPSRAHPLLMLAARAATEPASASAKCSVLLTDDNRELRVIGMARPDTAVSRKLPTAESSVIRCLVEGLCYSEIARRRGTSQRTIANQISAVFRRLQVSGRNELVQRLFVDGAMAVTRKPPSEAQVPPRLAVSRVARLGKPRRSA